MSEYTREEILKMIEENGGPEGLDLSGADLSEIDLSKEAIAQEVEKYQEGHPGKTPVWCSEEIESINLSGAILKEADLSRAHLEDAILSKTYLEGAELLGTHLEGALLLRTHLEGAILGGANLQAATFIEVNLQGAKLRFANCKGVSLSGENLEGADLSGAHLEMATLEEANLEKAVLFGAHLQEADLWKANLEGADLRRAHLEKVDLYDVATLTGAYFEGAFLEQTRLKKEHLGRQIGEEIDKEYYKAKEAYLLLKNNFNQIGRYDDASWAYTKERQMEKMTYHPKLGRKYYAKIEGLPEEASPKSWTWWRFYVTYTLKWLWDWIIECLCGYGEKPGNVVAVALGVLLIFPFLYWLTGLAPVNGQNLLWHDYFLYSLYAFATVEHPTLQAASRIAQLFTGLESLSGIALLALLMYTLGRRISRS